MIDRIVIVALVAGGVAAAFAIGKLVALQLSRSRARRLGWGQADIGNEPTTIVMFSGPRCAQCSAQRTEIDRARSQRPGVGYVEFDASVETELASRFAVLSVPTTVVVDRTGSIVYRNGRLVDSAMLGRQVDAVRSLRSPTT